MEEEGRQESGIEGAVIYSGLLSRARGFCPVQKAVGEGEATAASETTTAWTGGRRLFLRTWPAGCIDIAVST